MSTKLNILIDQNTTYDQEIELLNDDGDLLTISETMSCNASMKKAYASSNVIVFDTTLANGVLTLHLDETALDTILPGRYIWDVVFRSGDDVSKLIEGIATVRPTSSEAPEEV